MLDYTRRSAVFYKIHFVASAYTPGRRKPLEEAVATSVLSDESDTNRYKPFGDIDTEEVLRGIAPLMAPQNLLTLTFSYELLPPVAPAIPFSAPSTASAPTAPTASTTAAPTNPNFSASTAVENKKKRKTVTSNVEAKLAAYRVADEEREGSTGDQSRFRTYHSLVAM